MSLVSMCPDKNIMLSNITLLCILHTSTSSVSLFVKSFNTNCNFKEGIEISALTAERNNNVVVGLNISHG